MITLQQLIQSLPTAPIHMNQQDLETPVTAPVTEDNRLIEPGGVFVARQGLSVDGHHFIPDAIARGAAAIVGEQALQNLGVPYIRVADAQQATGYLAAAYHGFPSRGLIVVGITGTDGKTTTSHILHQILKQATGGKAGFISTIAADLGDHSEETGLHVTTPSAPQVQAYLAQMRRAGLTHVVLEMTSHGLAQGRLNGVEMDVAVMTNVTHEHLDFHGSWEAYRAAKGRLFEMLGHSQRKGAQPKVAVINKDDPSFDYFASFTADRVMSYGIENAADLQARAIEYAADGTRFMVADDAYQMQLVGAFNVYNALAALSAARGLGVSNVDSAAGLAQVEMISGRMERIDEGQDFLALVDFAHTPNALRRALDAGREMVEQGGRLIAVFGSAGLRDVEKRRMMAEVSAQLADFTILTAEDPRTESLDAILQMMADGCNSQGGVEGETFIRVPDRGKALYQACQMAQMGDVVMACGKGHEQSMCFGTTEFPWDDRQALRAALRGAPLQTLPTASSL
ncbi:UDP-N-acetylmuramoyl-L-alanyl-D-glutamate--2,6-diaminopimelate ligase [Phototrophicus methaneseepsis]|uniref:UDP-N-acetylmuramyl-tripeptide synthetase n=1 Tax=Phototrophicus methaneseepsis TaxID=2710758 RepID=A0A7S8IDU7_9CHLR|nr:UDP-N-acetylmuramoyl-L-alanyl-D-glutamate--2,6-diaminopimelate ligase [Phototrophicus methaneseepsis]QPC81897.1 UDP-N-acetylmuramoyl-L-alanyl-D-glutamate--2,6-diaminopimelate ligase [Phototrophicus methaneseepsis]